MIADKHDDECMTYRMPQTLSTANHVQYYVYLLCRGIMSHVAYFENMITDRRCPIEITSNTTPSNVKDICRQLLDLGAGELKVLINGREVLEDSQLYNSSRNVVFRVYNHGLCRAIQLWRAIDKIGRRTSKLLSWQTIRARKTKQDIKQHNLFTENLCDENGVKISAKRSHGVWYIPFDGLWDLRQRAESIIQKYPKQPKITQAGVMNGGFRRKWLKGCTLHVSLIDPIVHFAGVCERPIQCLPSPTPCSPCLRTCIAFCPYGQAFLCTITVTPSLHPSIPGGLWHRDCPTPSYLHLYPPSAVSLQHVVTTW